MPNPVSELIEILLDTESPGLNEVIRKHEALRSLSELGEAATEALPAIAQTLLQAGGPDVRPILHVPAAEAAWKIGGCGHRNLAMAILVWWLRDEFLGISQSAVEVLAEMGSEATEAVPALLAFAERRLDHGPFDYEIGGNSPVLPVLATALGNCAWGLPPNSDLLQSVREALRRIAQDLDAGTQSAATAALERLETKVG